MIPIIISVRGVIFASIIVLGLGIFVIVNNSKEKSEYDKASGTIGYFERISKSSNPTQRRLQIFESGHISLSI